MERENEAASDAAHLANKTFMNQRSQSSTTGMGATLTAAWINEEN
jgi:hypothetical protein